MPTYFLKEIPRPSPRPICDLDLPTCAQLDPNAIMNVYLKHHVKSTII